MVSQSSNDDENPHREVGPRTCDGASIAAFGVYLAASILYFGRSLTLHTLATSYIGRNADPSFFMWCLAWWPYALSHGVDPILTRVIFAPGGVNLGWVTTMPLASVLMWPVTASRGPVFSYNLLALAALPLAAWSAFVLCRQLTGRFWPALAGGYAYGFSAYFLAHLLAGHMIVLLVFPVPLAVCFAVRCYEGTLGRRSAIWMIGLALGAQFLMSAEIFATVTMFAGIVIVLGLLATGGGARERVLRMAGVLASAAGIGALLGSPLIYYMFAYERPRGQIWSARLFSNDLLNFVVPTEVNQIGRLPFSFYSRYAGNLFERDGYIGPVLLVLAILFARRRWTEPYGKVVIGALVVICVLSLGPVLKVAGHSLLPMPQMLLTVMPLISQALPSRFMMYGFLALAIIAAEWFARDGASRAVKLAVAGAMVAFSLPNLNPLYWVSKVDTPGFFAEGLYRKHLSAGENVLVTPYSTYGNTMLWQAQCDFAFNLAGGWTGIVPNEYKQWPFVGAIMGWNYLPDGQRQMMAFLANHRVGAVVVGPGDPARRFWPEWMKGIATPVEIGGVTLYPIAPEKLAPYAAVSAAMAEGEAGREVFAGLLSAVAKYQADQGDPKKLSPYTLQSLGLLPAGWNAQTPFDYFLPPQPYYRGVWLGYLDDGTLAIGLTGGYAAVRPLVERYGAGARRIYFPFPRKFDPAAPDTQGDGLLLMMFDRAGLKRAIEAIPTTSAAPSLPQ